MPRISYVYRINEEYPKSIDMRRWPTWQDWFNDFQIEPEHETIAIDEVTYVHLDRPTHKEIKRFMLVVDYATRQEMISRGLLRYGQASLHGEMDHYVATLSGKGYRIVRPEEKDITFIEVHIALVQQREQEFLGKSRRLAHL